MDRIPDPTEIVSNIPYIAGLSAFIMNTLEWLNDMAAAISVIVVVATYFTSLYFKISDRKLNLREKRRRK